MTAPEWDYHRVTQHLNAVELQWFIAGLYAMGRVTEFPEFHGERSYYQERAALFSAYARQKLGVVDTER